ncbi:MAG: hypothetical protein ABIH68_07250 [bacterium]
MNNFQRKGSVSNAHAGNDFENNVMDFFSLNGIKLEKNILVSIGIQGRRKIHNYDLGNINKNIVVECKSHTWTETEKVPSAKVTTWDQAMYYFFIAPKKYRKIFVVLKSWSNKRKETLCDYYMRLKDHLIPDDVEIWEYDEKKSIAVRKK